MVVLMPNATATIRRQTEGGVNPHGERIQGNFGPPISEPLPALIEQRGDGGWSVSLDESLWPVREGDVAIDQNDRIFVIRTADRLINVFDPTVNYVRCEALRVISEGTEPPDSWFVGRTP